MASSSEEEVNLEVKHFCEFSITWLAFSNPLPLIINLFPCKDPAVGVIY